MNFGFLLSLSVLCILMWPLCDIDSVCSSQIDHCDNDSTMSGLYDN